MHVKRFRPSRTLLLALTLIIWVHGIAQNFDGFNYQAVIRDPAGDPLPGRAVGVQFTITSGVLDPHVETFAVMTDAQGMINLGMGEGQLQNGPAFSAIDWSSSTAWTYCFAVDINGGSDYQLLGCEAFKAVPFAMHARTSPGWKLIDSDLINTNAGYIGIGTEAPTGPFEVRKPDGSFVMRNWSGGGEHVIVTDLIGRNGFMPQERFSSEDSPNWVDIGLSTGQAFAVETNDLPRLTIHQDGHVGVGTTTPSTTLDVAGTFKLADGSQQTDKVLTSDAEGNATWKSVSAESILGNGNVPAGDLSCLTSTAIIGTGTFPRAIDLAGDHAYVLNVFSHNMTIFNISDPETPSVSATINTGTNPIDVAVEGGHAYVVGNTNDMRVYDISDPSAPSLRATVLTGANPNSVAVANGFAYVVNSASNNMMVFDLVNPAAPNLVATIATGTGPRSVAVSGGHAYVVNGGSDNMMVFNVSNPAAPNISSTIATGSSPYFISVASDHAYVVNFNSNSMMVFNVVDPSTPTLRATIATGSQPSSVAAEGRFAYVTNSATSSNSMMVFNISDPATPTLAATIATGTSPLAVAVKDRNAYVVNFFASNLQVFELFCPAMAIAVDPVTGGLVAAPVAGANKWRYNGTTIYNENTGNVGIGTSTPADKLTVRTATSNYGFAHTDGSVTVGSFVGGSAGGGWFGTKSAHNLHFFTSNSSAQMTLAMSGNVGIGTTTPQSKLAVNGKITCKEVEVMLAGFPDYVFEKDYHLMPLTEVDAYIAANGHLPNVPSACEVEENGLGLGEMNKILLEKVEELTLHAIAKEKEMLALRKGMEDRIARLEALIGGNK